MLNLILTAIKEIIVGTIIAVLGFYIGFKYLLPILSRDMAISSADAIINHPKIKPIVEKLKKLEPILDQIKELDLQELFDTLKHIKVFVELQNKNSSPPPPKTKKSDVGGE